MNPKTLEFLLGYSDIEVTMNTYTHLGLEDLEAEIHSMEAAEAARQKQEKITGLEKALPQKAFRAV